MALTADATAETRVRLGRVTSNLFKLLLGLAVIIAAGATYVAVTDNSPNAAAQWRLNEPDWSKAITV